MVQDPKRKILLPKTLDERLTALSGLNQETVGALFYTASPAGRLLELKVDGLFILGIGHRYEVRPEDARWSIMERFLNDNLQYGFIHWHTHPSGNAVVAGTDLDYFREAIAADPNFLAMIVTRQRKITVARGQGTRNTSVAVVPDPLDFAQRNAYVNSKIDDAARSLGYVSLPHLQATRARQT